MRRVRLFYFGGGGPVDDASAFFFSFFSSWRGAGDSCVKWRELFGGECVGLREHVANTRVLSKRYNVHTVFVASDDPNAAGQLPLFGRQN